MKDVTLSFIRAQIALYSGDRITEREFLQNTLDLCIERIVDLDKGRDDECVTGSYDRSELAGVLVEAEMLNSQPPPANNEQGSFPPSISPALCLSSPSIEIDLTVDDLEDTEDNDAPVCPRISITPAPYKVL